MLAENIKRARKERKWTQAVLAEKMCINPANIASWELGRCQPNSEKLFLLSQALGVTADYLIGAASISEIVDLPHPITIVSRKMAGLQPYQLAAIDMVVTAMLLENERSK